MITIDNVTYRNIQEQVQKNKEDIAAFKAVDQVLIDFGIKVLGQVNTKEDIPEGEYEYGDAYLVGTEEPYDIFIWTRGETPEFINLGPLAIQGPKGDQGDIGPQGPQGVRGSQIYADAGSPSEHSELDPNEGDMYIRTDNASPTNLTKGYVYQFTNNDWIYKGSLRGEVGPQGQRGVPGPRGYTGDVGPMGPKGDPGQSFVIQSVLNDPSLLPNPDETQRNYAYVVKTSSYNRLYFITGEDTLIWDYVDMGNVGSTVIENGQEVAIYNADKAKLRTIQFYNPNAVYKDNELGGYAIVGEGLVETGDSENPTDLEATAFVLPLDDTNEITWSADQSGTKLQAHLAGTVTNKLAKALVTPNSAPSATKLVGIDTANSQTLIDTTDFIKKEGSGEQFISCTTSGGEVLGLNNRSATASHTWLRFRNQGNNVGEFGVKNDTAAPRYYNSKTGKGYNICIDEGTYNNPADTAVSYLKLGSYVLMFGRCGGYASSGGEKTYDLTFPVTLASANYFVMAVNDTNTSDNNNYNLNKEIVCYNRTTTGCTFKCNYSGGNSRGVNYLIIGRVL